MTTPNNAPHPERDAEAHRLVTEGKLSRAEMGRLLGVSEKTPKRMAERHELRMAGHVIRVGKGPRWTDAEDAIIVANPKMSTRELGELLDRPMGGVKHRIEQLCLRRFADRAKTRECPVGPDHIASRMKANVLHLVDLKRAGYSPTMTGDRPYKPVTNPIFFGGAIAPRQPQSATGSHAAMCEAF